MLKQKPKIGLLPFYLELLDSWFAEMRPQIESFVTIIAEKLNNKGIEVVIGKTCGKKEEFVETVEYFEKQKVIALITLHLTYSPSLESADILAKTNLPLIVLDTTFDFDFSPQQEKEKILFNHGIHGVQDMCNLLLRNKKLFFLEAGHYQQTDVLDRIVKLVNSVQIAEKIKKIRVGIIGKPFNGMGDFAINPEILKKTIGITTVTVKPEDICQYLPKEDDPLIQAEITNDNKLFRRSKFSLENYKQTIRTSLAVRKWIEKEHLSAFTVNFLEITKTQKLPVMPFLEASKSLSRGIGYAGEGDVLTASLIAAIAEVYPEVSFTEMFCPDWKNNRIFLSHMGEININLAQNKPLLIEQSWNYTDAENPIFAAASFKPGEAILVNLAPAINDTFTLIVAPVKVIAEGKTTNFSNNIRGWVKPYLSISDFLKRYSLAGGTHHLALVYGKVTQQLINFGKIMNWSVVVIE